MSENEPKVENQQQQEQHDTSSSSCSSHHHQLEENKVLNKLLISSSECNETSLSDKDGTLINNLVSSSSTDQSTAESASSEPLFDGNNGKYIVDSSLCGVGAHLRKLGVDTAYSKEYSDAYILYLARNQNRMIITRSTKLLQRIRQHEEKIENYKKKIEILRDLNVVESLVQQRLMKRRTDEEIEEEREELVEIVQEEEKQKYQYYIVKAVGKYDQLKEVVDNFKLVFKKENLFGRCFSCNGPVIEVRKEDIEHLVFEKTYLNTDKFTQCQSCNQVFWGSENGNAYQQKFFANSIEFCTEYSYHPPENK